MIAVLKSIICSPPLGSLKNVCSNRRCLWVADCAVIITFLALGAAFQVVRTEGVRQFCELTSDAANIASFAAAWDHPELFERDPVLSEPRNFRWYATVHVPLIRALARVTGHYGDAFISVLGVHVFVYMTGYYVLGRLWLGSRLWSFLFACMNLVVVPAARAELWGMFVDPLPRVTFGALFGFLLAGVLWLKAIPRAWPVIMVIAGLMSYVHPVSTPTVGLMLWMGFWGLIPREWSTVRRLGYMLFLAGVFLVAAAPFAAHFAHTCRLGAKDKPPEVREAQQHRLAGSIEPLKNLESSLKKSVQYLVLPMGVIGAALLFKLGGEARRSMLLPSLWLSGVLLASAVLPIVLHAISRLPATEMLQLQVVRAIRFVYPMMYLFTMRAIVELENRIIARRDAPPLCGSRLIQVAIVLLVGWIAAVGAKINEVTLIPTHLAYLVQGKIDPESPSRVRSIVEAVKSHTLPGSRILPVNVDELAIRYASLRPVAFCYKDGAVAVNSDTEKALFWYRNYKELERITQDLEKPEAAAKLVALAKRVGADYVAVRRATHRPDDWPSNCDVVWGNGHFTLLRVSASAPNSSTRSLP